MSEIRLQKLIADCGVTSRRKAEELILQGRVEVNGEIVTTLGTKVNPSNDVVMVDGETIDLNKVEKIYILLHKPRGYVTTLNDPEGRNTVMDLVKEVTERIYPVGRLDYLSEGLLMLTNDGEIANQIMHPSHEVIKVYEVKVFGAVNETILKKLRAGAQLEEGFVKPKSVRVFKQLGGKTWVEFRIGEGKNREIRKLCEAAGLTVDKLKRVAIGGISVDGIAPGKYVFMTKKDIIDGVGIGRKTPIEYWSNKRTIDIKRKGPQACTLADDKAYRRLRRDDYFKSLKEISERKISLKKAEREEKFKVKEAAHAKRKERKKRREELKEERKGSVHAQML